MKKNNQGHDSTVVKYGASFGMRPVNTSDYIKTVRSILMNFHLFFKDHDSAVVL